MTHSKRSRWNWSHFAFLGTRARAIVTRVVPLFLLFHPHVADAVPPPPPIGKRWVLVWSDDFNGTTLDASKWNHRSEAFRSERRQSGHRIRWRYEHDNVSLRDSYLVLRNTRDPRIIDGADVAKAAAIDSKGKFEQTYGYFEASIRIAPTADGMHTAFWLQNDNRDRTAADGGVDGPSDGAEIDILESVYTSDRYVWAVHWEGNSLHADVEFAPMHDGQFHVFAVAWTPDSYTFFADGQQKSQRFQGISHSDGYVILSTGVSWHQGNARAGTFPNEALVDWVRVYELQDIPAEPPQENTVVLEPPDPRGSRDIGRITLVSSQPGTIQASWEAPSEAPANYRISWAKVGEDFRTWTDQSGNAFPTATSQTIAGLEEGEEYKVMVRASYSGTAGDWSSEVVITVAASPPANDAPTADAGSDQTVEEGSAVTLSGTAYDPDNDTLTYQWTHDRDELDISLDDPASLSTTFTAPQVGSDATITFTLTATDEHGATGSDAVAITVQDISSDPPQGNTVVLEPPDPRDSRDIGRITLVSSQPGTIQASWEAPSEAPANYRISWAKAGEDFKTWTDRSGNAFPTATSQTITGLEEGEEYKVMVLASYSGTAGDWSGEVSITVAASSANDAPTADAGSDQTVEEGSAVTLSGTASDSDNDTLTYQWTHDQDELDISLDDPAALSTTFTAPQVGFDATITFTLTATDEHGDTGSDFVAITVQDTSSDPPQGNTVVLEPPDPRDPRDIGRITLVSSQPGTIQASWEAPSEAPANYRISWAKVGEDFKTWTDQSGNAFPTATSQTITGLEEGEEYKVMVRASYSGTAGDWSSEVVITVLGHAANDAPTADAGSDQTVEEGSAVTLSGTASDSDNDTLTYQWTHDQDELDISLDDPAALSTTFTAPQVESDTTITFTLTAIDEHGDTGSDAVAITVQDVPADPPPENTVVLEPPDPRGSRDIGRITLVSSQPGTIQASWEAPTEDPADYRISWAKEGEDFKTWTDNTGNAFPTEPSYTITGLEGGEEYKVKIRARYDGSSGDWSGEAVITVIESQASKPVVPSLPFGLGENYPNPFNPETQIAYTLSTAGPVELAIYNILGQRVRILVQEIQAAGSYQVVWKGRNDQGVPVASGIYLYRLSSTQEVQVRRLLLLK